MILVGDIGNTETKICLVNSQNNIFKKINLNTKKINNIKLKAVFKKKDIFRYKIKKVLFCSVVPETFLIIKKFFKKNYRFKCYELKELKLDKLLKIKVNKKQIGSDRLANAIAVIDKKRNFIVVDFGTATNFDVVIKDSYIGGILAPGVSLSLNTLSDKASLIPKIKLNKIKNVIGKNTTAAIRAGFYHGYSGLIDNIIKMIIKQSGKSFNIILTGGYSYLFKNSIKGKTIIKKDLTINGVLKAAVFTK